VMDQAVIGPCTPDAEGRARQVAELLSAAGVPARSSATILPAVWEKTILSAALSALCAVTQQTMRAVIRHADGRALMVQVLREAIAVAEASGVTLRAGFFEYALDYLERSDDHLPSLALDLREGRDLEIDVLNGAIVAAGEARGVPTPCNRTLTTLVRLLRDHAASGA
jgi:2-dehydropantoate 2-reductase